MLFLIYKCFIDQLQTFITTALAFGFGKKNPFSVREEQSNNVIKSFINDGSFVSLSNKPSSLQLGELIIHQSGEFSSGLRHVLIFYCYLDMRL